MKYINQFKLYCPKLEKYIYVGDTLKFGAGKTVHILIEITETEISLYSEVVGIKKYKHYVVTDIGCNLSQIIRPD